MGDDGMGTVLVTGASRGLGRALAVAFARAGAPVAICARGADELEAAADEVRLAGAPCVARALDVADEAAVTEWAAEAERLLGPPGVLVNNASLLGPRVPLTAYPLPAWREVMEVNLAGALIATQAVLPRMLERREGVVINVSSGAAIPPRSDWGAYAVSKLALEGLSRNLARELAGTGVRVNLVDPGSMRTGMRAAAYPEEDPGTRKLPADIAPLILWLAGPGARDVTGERFQADEWLAARGSR